MIGYEIIFNEVPEGENTNHFMFYTDSSGALAIKPLLSWIKSMGKGLYYKIKKTENVPLAAYDTEVIKLEKVEEQETGNGYCYRYFYINCRSNDKGEFLVRVRNGDDILTNCIELIRSQLIDINFEVVEITFADMINGLCFGYSNIINLGLVLNGATISKRKLV